MKLLVMTGGKHPYHQSTPILTDFLREAGHEVDVTEDADALVSDSMREYDALVYNTRRVEEMTLDDVQRKALTQYVGSGKGFVVIHCAAGLPETWPEFHDITGGGWVYGGVSTTPGYGQYEVTVKNGGHPCAAGVSTSFITNDELYMNLGWRPGNDVFLTCEYDGISQPAAWTRRYGNGRVFKITLGHDGLAFRTPEFQRLIINGAEWAARS